MADWAMVGITFVYVIATIFICIFNYHSANAASKQIDLTKMQYVEDTRLKLLPYLHVQKINFSERVNGTIEHSFSKDCHKCPPTSPKAVAQDTKLFPFRQPMIESFASYSNPPMKAGRNFV